VGLSRHLQLLADDPMAAPMQRRYYLKVQILPVTVRRAETHGAPRITTCSQR